MNSSIEVSTPAERYQGREVLVVRHAFPVLSETFIRRQVAAMRRTRGVIFCRDQLASDGPYEIAGGSQLSRFERFFYTIFRSTKIPLRHLRGREVALVHAHFAIEGVYALKLAKKLRVPLVVTLHGFDISMHRSALLRSMKPAWVNFALFEARLKKSPTQFIAVSEHVRRAAVERGYPGGQIRTMPIGVPVEQTVTREPRGQFLHVGRLVEKKGTSTLLRSFAKISSETDWELKIVGDGPLRNELEALSRELAIDSRVVFVGAQSSAYVRESMETSGILVVPSKTAHNGDQEGLPTVVLEALALGVPVLATRHAGIPEVVVDGQNGWLVDEGDEAGLARTLLGVASMNAIELQGFFSRARESVEKSHSLETQTAKLEELYDELIEGAQVTK
nr:glycosyltransferase [Microbacterium dextranolyticum]